MSEGPSTENGGQSARYIRRVVDDELDALLPGIAAISIEGARAVGKTATALRRAGSSHRLDDPAQLEILRAAPARVVSGLRPVLIDEWQRLPESWDIVRRAVDADPRGGQFLLTGSATPARSPTHSGAGRIVTLRMRPMGLEERGVERPSVSLASLLTGRRPPLSGSTSIDLEGYVDEILASGFPGLRHLTARQLRAQLDGYLDRVLEHDLAEMGGLVVRNPQLLRRWLTAYAAATSTTADGETIRRAASLEREPPPARTTTQLYRDALVRLWIVDPVPAWLPTRNRIARLAGPPTHQVVDPALAARLLGVGRDALLGGVGSGLPVPRDGTLLGGLFESLVTLGVRSAAQAAEASVHHLRTRAGEREIDLIVERDDGRVLAIEVKLTQTVSDGDVRNLRWIQGQLGEQLLDAIVVTTGPEAYRRPDGIGVVPAALLGH